MEAALALLVLGDAGAAVRLAWYGAAIAVALLCLSLTLGSDGVLCASLAILGLVLLARADDRLVLAPLYGGGLVIVAELARTCDQLARADRVGPGLIRARLLGTAVCAGLGAGAASLVALAASAGPDRSVGITAAATAAVATAFGVVVATACRAPRLNVGEAPGTSSGQPDDEGQSGR